MIALVCGCRHWKDTELIHKDLDLLWHSNRDLLIVEGGARGADRAAGVWATEHSGRGVEWMRFAADWPTHDPEWCKSGCWSGKKAYCLGAGAKRNQQMLDFVVEVDDGATLVLAFKDNFNYDLDFGGTEDMVRRAQERGIPYRVVSHDGY